MNNQNISDLPEDFLRQMNLYLGDEFPAFLESIENDRAYGLRVNPLKIDIDVSGDLPDQSVNAIAGLKERFRLRPVPWCKTGWYYDPDTRPGRSSLFDAGAYYIQEPSAMAPVELLDPKEGEICLDLCAAPGGKSTQIASLMNQKGLLVSNEINSSRAKTLSSNIERMGITNTVVTNERPETLASRFPGSFDKILVDAPCSGEGMFRKDDKAADEWSHDNVLMCARRQKEILNSASSMLKPGGRMVYSTCTFSPEEDELVIERFLTEHPDFYPEEDLMPDGFEAFDIGRGSDGKIMPGTYRIWPHKTEGEGHFMAVMRRSENAMISDNTVKCKRFGPGKGFNPSASYLKDFIMSDLIYGNEPDIKAVTGSQDYVYRMFGDELYLVPYQMPDMNGMRILRAGLDIGTFRKDRFEPSHALAMFFHKEQVLRWISFPSDSDEIEDYLKGGSIPFERIAEKDVLMSEELTKKCHSNGWVLVLSDDCSAGWAKIVGNTLKNHYPKGLRKL